MRISKRHIYLQGRNVEFGVTKLGHVHYRTIEGFDGRRGKWTVSEDSVANKQVLDAAKIEAPVRVHLYAAEKQQLDRMLEGVSPARVLDYIARVAYDKQLPTADALWNASKQIEDIEISESLKGPKLSL